jgi:DNA-binding CsgD family transcriptional regulator
MSAGVAVVTRVVGRDAELASLRALVDLLPVGGVAVVEGEPGVGKTTLLNVVAARSDAAGSPVVRTGADEFTAARPLGLLAGEFGASATSTDIDDLLTGLERRAQRRGVTIVLDDLQWADEASLALLAPFVRRAVPIGALVVLAMRSWPRVEALDDLLDRLAPLKPLTIRLAPLSLDELCALGEVDLGRPIGPGVRDLLGVTGGNPFYALSLLDLLSSENMFDESADVADVDPTTVQLDRTSLGSLVTRRVAALGRGTERILQHAAALGRSVGVDELAALVAEPVEQTAEHLSVAVRADVLDRAGDRLVFRHDLVRSALENSVVPAMRLSIHRRAGALALDRGDRAAAATHLLRADVGVDDVDTLVGLVGDCSPSVGLALLDRALGLVGADDARYPLLAVERVDFLLWSGDAEGAVAAARELLATQLDDEAAASLRTTIAHALFVLGRAAEAVDTWVRLPDGIDDVLRAGELAEMAFATLFAGRLTAAAELAQASLDLTDESTAVAIASLVLAWVAAAAGDVETALPLADTAVRAAPAANETARRIGPHLVRSMVHDLAGDTPAALADIAVDQIDVADRAALVRIPFRHMTAAIAYFRAGAFDDALADADAGAAAGADSGVHGLDGWLRTVPALIALYRTGPDAADTLLGDAELQLGSDWWFWTKGVTLAARGRSADALDLFETVASIGASVGSVSSVALVAPDAARSAILLGATERGDELVRRATARVTSKPLRARLEWASALLGGDVDALARCAAALAPIRPFEAAQATHDLAVLLAGSARRVDDARAAARDALVAYERCGASWCAARLRADVRDHGIRFRAAPASARVGWEALTATEILVVDLLATGLTNSEIAERLVISRRTVESHLVHVYDKVGVRSRADLTDLARRRA